MPSRTADGQQRATYLTPIAVFFSLVACFSWCLLSPATTIASLGMA